MVKLYKVYAPNTSDHLRNGYIYKYEIMRYYNFFDHYLVV